MKRIVSDPKRVLQFMHGFLETQIETTAGMRGIGLEQNGALIAGVLFERNNGSNIFMHVAAVTGKRWLTREYLNYCFYYPFVECGVSRITGWIEKSNIDSRRFAEHLCFKKEALLSGAAKDGGDVIIYVMRKNECRFLGRNDVLGN